MPVSAKNKTIFFVVIAISCALIAAGCGKQEESEDIEVTFHVKKDLDTSAGLPKQAEPHPLPDRRPVKDEPVRPPLRPPRPEPDEPIIVERWSPPGESGGEVFADASRPGGPDDYSRARLDTSPGFQLDILIKEAWLTIEKAHEICDSAWKEAEERGLDDAHMPRRFYTTVQKAEENIQKASFILNDKSVLLDIKDRFNAEIELMQIQVQCLNYREKFKGVRDILKHFTDRPLPDFVPHEQKKEIELFLAAELFDNSTNLGDLKGVLDRGVFLLKGNLSDPEQKLEVLAQMREFIIDQGPPQAVSEVNTLGFKIIMDLPLKEKHRAEAILDHVSSIAMWSCDRGNPELAMQMLEKIKNRAKFKSQDVQHHFIENIEHMQMDVKAEFDGRR